MKGWRRRGAIAWALAWAAFDAHAHGSAARAGTDAVRDSIVANETAPPP